MGPADNRGMREDLVYHMSHRHAYSCDSQKTLLRTLKQHDISALIAWCERLHSHYMNTETANQLISHCCNALFGIISTTTAKCLNGLNAKEPTVKIDKWTFIYKLQSNAYLLSKSLGIDIGPHCVIDASWSIEKKIEFGRALAFWDLAASVKIGALIGDPIEHSNGKGVNFTYKSIVGHLCASIVNLTEFYQFDHQHSLPSQNIELHDDLVCAYGRCLALRQVKNLIETKHTHFESLV